MDRVDRSNRVNAGKFKIPLQEYEEHIEKGEVYCKKHGWQSIDDFYHHKDRGYVSWNCRKCVAIRQKEIRITCGEEVNATVRKRRLDNRLEIYSHYCTGSICCSICGEEELKFLCLDHINGGGLQHRKNVGGVRETFSEIKRSGFPDGYRVLCHNCNLKHGCRDFFGPGLKEKPELELLQTPKAIKARQWRRTNKDKVNSYYRKYRQKLKLEVVGHYGGKCACCEADDIDVLSIDHISGGGRQHRAKIGKVVSFQYLKSQGFPEGYQILCMNCNQAKGIYGYCPHNQPQNPPSAASAQLSHT